MEILLILLFIAGIAWWVVLRDKSATENTSVAPYKLEPNTEIIQKEQASTESNVQNEKSSDLASAPEVVKKVRKPRTPKADKETVVKKATTPKKAVVKKATTSKKVVAKKESRSKKI